MHETSLSRLQCCSGDNPIKVEVIYLSSQRAAVVRRVERHTVQVRALLWVPEIITCVLPQLAAVYHLPGSSSG